MKILFSFILALVVGIAGNAMPYPMDCSMMEDGGVVPIVQDKNSGETHSFHHVAYSLDGNLLLNQELEVKVVDDSGLVLFELTTKQPTVIIPVLGIDAANYHLEVRIGTVSYNIP